MVSILVKTFGEGDNNGCGCVCGLLKRLHQLLPLFVCQALSTQGIPQVIWVGTRIRHVEG